MAAITSQALGKMDALPWLYIPTEDPEQMRSWGLAKGYGDGSVAVYARLFPGALVAPHAFGQFASRGDLLYHGAEPADDFPTGPTPADR